MAARSDQAHPLTDGTTGALTLRVGDQAVENTPLIVSSTLKLADLRELRGGVIRHMKVGHTAWVG
jgi:hypothetical protein